MNDEDKLLGWSIILFGGMNLIGKLDETGMLSPAYELHTQVQPHPKGLNIVRSVFPVLLLSSISELYFSASLPPNGYIVISIKDLSRKEREELKAAVAQCENLVASMRLQDRGILIADKLPK